MRERRFRIVKTYQSDHMLQYQQPVRHKKAAKERAVRLRALRAMCRYTRSDLARRHGIPAATLQNWETPRQGGITDKGAYRIITVFSKLGMHVSHEWLMQGTGPEPYLESQGVLRRMQNLLTRSRGKKVDHCALFEQWHKQGFVLEVDEKSALQGCRGGDKLLSVPVRATAKKGDVKNRLCIVAYLDGALEVGYIAEIKFSKKQVMLFSADPRHEKKLMPYNKIWQVVGIIPRE